ncbi:MAG: glycosyltransferase family 2 protein [Bacteroidaceae bacterium]|jgi:dolichol-phosphate mannosyltransferase|uniref:glycosyltransferase family 2 protein n=1 Tax=unclassified Bacteroides TaxID=2646097 RepID=UPI0004E1B23E|nr:MULTISPECIES: glycosyltransferase family 2 protein [unclassified Bacteroides]MBR6368574.1 glycosyltransferase family 2 protein [Bacteroidaceae bacterium]
MELSIVSPIYRGEKMLDELVRRIIDSVKDITDDYEIVLVNDCSPDNSWEKIVQLCNENKKVKGVNLSRNFGQHYAITAGLSKTSGNWVVVMDCDLQDRPEEIPNLYAKTREGFDSVFAQRVERQDTFMKRLSSAAFYFVFSFLTDSKQDKSVANFGIYNRKVVNAILSMGDSIRYFPIMAQWVGFRKGYLPVQHAERQVGSSSYSFFKLMRLASDNMIGFSDKPLRLMLTFGFYVVIGSLLVALYYFVKWCLGLIVVDGFTTMVISLWLIAGILTMMLGITGLYIGKIFDRVKGRPVFIIGETVNFSEK